MSVPVLITTSGIGKRLDNLTKFTNKALVKVGDKYAICYIIEQYAQSTEFIVTIGYFGKYVKDFLLLAYPSYNFTFVEIDNYDGPGSSLGYSLLKAKKLLNRPFIFHCCDAIITTPIKFNINKNTLFVAKYENSSQYTSIKTSNTSVIKINSKGSINFDYIYTGISYIYNFIEFWKSLRDIYNTNHNLSELSDVHSLQQMLSAGIPFEYSELTEWFDTGNKESYKKVCEYFKPTYNVLEKDYESICFFEDSVIKFINDPEINKKRIERGRNLYPIAPKILAYSDNFISMEKINGPLLAEYYNHGEIKKLLKWAKNNLWIDEKIDTSYIINCKNFYITKTLKRIQTLDILNNEYNIINGLHTDSAINMITNLDSSILTTDIFTKFHGDFILDNIIKNEGTYKLLDWRHEFDNQLMYGDKYYDLAKLRHNIIFNHENISNNLYSVKYNNNEVTVDLKCNYFLINQLQDFDTFVIENGLNLKKIKILTAIIWLNMSPLYEGNLKEFLFYFGKYNLQLLLN